MDKINFNDIEEIKTTLINLFKSRTHLFISETDFKFWFAQALVSKGYDVTFEYPFEIKNGNKKSNAKVDLVVWNSKKEKNTDGIIAAFEFKYVVQNRKDLYKDIHNIPLSSATKPGPEDRYNFVDDIYRLEQFGNIVPTNRYCIFLTNCSKYTSKPTPRESVAVDFALYPGHDLVANQEMIYKKGTRKIDNSTNQNTSQTNSKHPPISLLNNYEGTLFNWEQFSCDDIDETKIWYLILKVK